jgi:uncharacterized protein DUF4157
MFMTQTDPVRSSLPSFSSMRPTLRQRKCACGGGDSSGGACESCRKKALQRRACGSAQKAVAPPIVHEVLRSPGQPLDAATRAFFEPRFGHDFSKVRIHTDVKAAESAQAVNAHAYAVDQDVVFGASQYAPGTPSGNRLLAHELTHVVQQRGGAAAGSDLKVAPEHDAGEAEAERAADSFHRSQAFTVAASAPAAVGTLRRAAIYSGRILDEGTCGDLVAKSKWICCDPTNGAERKGRKKDVEGTDCPSQKFAPIFTCDNNCTKALSKGCSDSDNWMALPDSRFANRKCNQDLVICANGKSTHAYVRDKSEIDAWEVSRAIPAALGLSPDFSGAIYGSESDAAFKKDKRCGAVEPKTNAPAPDGGSPAPAPQDTPGKQVSP